MPSLLDVVVLAVVFLAVAQFVACGFVGMALAQAKVPPRTRIVVMAAVVVLTAALVIAGAVVMYDAAWVDYRRRR